MDLRARLILSLSPLLVALAIIGVVAVYSQQRIAQAIHRVDNTARDLVEVAQSESLILLEHYYVREIIAGRQVDRNELEKIRAEARNFFAAYGQFDAGYIELELVARFEAMVAQHDAALTFLDRGNQEKARELISSTDYHRNLRAIHNLSLGAQLEYEAEYLRRVAELERIANEGFWIASAVVGVAVLIALAFAVSLIWQVGKSVDQLTADAERLAHTDERGQLSAVSSINQLQRLRDSFQYLLDTNHERQQQLTAAIEAQQAQLEREMQLQATIRALSLPVTPLGPQTIFVPLVGHLDAERSKQLEQTVLNAIQQRRARTVVIDINGLATLDEDSIATLIRVGRGTRLLGAQSILVGTRPEQALLLADIPSDLFRFARDIPAALSLAG
ncbi:anti-anti-sigma factor [Chloroflexus islandicus]|uniref:Anti-anti-sigma factor n=1 Tax=Chloroflexus islandicus TaxID=1707952 RepID=A0A178MFE2_9CHLR|nr:STAS domain-containing protein [Chloroflexus islandicus]OAN46808.1 anti-anti-sigma factor [Chloroflexus islandicus]